MKEPTGTKGSRLTGNLSLPGRFLVLQPHGQGVCRGASAVKPSATGCEPWRCDRPGGTGLLVRTEADGVSERSLMTSNCCANGRRSNRPLKQPTRRFC